MEKSNIWAPMIYEESDKESPWCWGLEINSERYGRYLFIEQLDTNEFVVCCYPYSGDLSKEFFVANTLPGAKSWVSNHMDIFTD